MWNLWADWVGFGRTGRGRRREGQCGRWPYCRRVWWSNHACCKQVSGGGHLQRRRRQRRWWRGETRRRRHFLNADGFTHQRARFWCAFSTHYFERLSHLEGGDPFHQWTRSPRDPMPSQDLEGFFALEAAARATKPPCEGASGELTDGLRRGRPYPSFFEE